MAWQARSFTQIWMLDTPMISAAGPCLPHHPARRVGPQTPRRRTLSPTTQWPWVITGINPAHDTRFGSSKPAERLWQDRIYRVSFCLVRRSPQETPSSQVKRTFVCHDPLRTPTSPVDRGSVALPQGLLTLGFDPSRFQTEPPACYRASWQPPGPDLHRRATTGCQTKNPYTRTPLPFYWAHESPRLESVVEPKSHLVAAEDYA